MLPKYVAFKKENLNLYSIFEVIPSDIENGLLSVRFIPKVVKNLEVYSFIYEINNNIIDSCYVKRITRKAPFFKNTFFQPSYTGHKFKVRYNYVNYNVPVISPPTYLGSRWSENMIEYLFAFDATDNDIDDIRNIEYPGKNNKDYIVNFKNSGSTMINMGNTDARDLTPNYVVKGWLKNCINENCPITLAELTAQNICATPCFHAISHEAAVEWISSNNNCPVCRKECGISELIRL